jgi:ribosomal-protein-alanine N-acetyltransferase
MNFVKGCESLINDIVAIEKNCFSQPFGKNDIESDLKTNPFSRFYLLEDNNKYVGYISYWITFDSATICRFGVLKDERKKGYGQKLLDYAIKDCSESGVSIITLEVRASNKEAINLYLKNDFTKITTKPHYYSNGEDAIYMAKGV